MAAIQRYQTVIKDGGQLSFWIFLTMLNKSLKSAGNRGTFVKCYRITENKWRLRSLYCV